MQNLLIIWMLSFNYIVCAEEQEILPLGNKALENHKLFGGDIVGYKKHSYRNAIANEIQLWNNGIVPFLIDSSLESKQELILRAMNNYHENTCIQFVKRTTEYDYVNITVEQGCFSNVGRTGGMQILSLGEGCYYIGSIVHELGHAIGLFHEHQRHDRDQYIDVFYNNIREDSKDQFDPMPESAYRLPKNRLYDYDSVMHYGSHAFSKDASIETMRTKSGRFLLEVFEKYGLSQNDISAINQFYKC